MDLPNTYYKPGDTVKKDVESIIEFSKSIRQESIEKKRDTIEKSINAVLDLIQDEPIYFCLFTGIIHSPEGNQGNSFVAVTNKHVVMAGAKSDLIKSMSIKSIDVKEIESMEVRPAIITTNLRIKTAGGIVEITGFGVKTRKWNTGTPVINSFIAAVNEAKKASAGSVSVPAGNSAADEIKKYMELLYIGAITQEEFDAKKKQLLGL